MHRSLIAAVLAGFMATLDVAHPIAANQDQPDAWRATLAQAGFPVPADLRYRLLADGTIFFDGNVVKVADTHQQTLQVLNPNPSGSQKSSPAATPRVMVRWS